MVPVNNKSNFGTARSVEVFQPGACVEQDDAFLRVDPLLLDELLQRCERCCTFRGGKDPLRPAQLLLGSQEFLVADGQSDPWLSRMS